MTTNGEEDPAEVLGLGEPGTPARSAPPAAPPAASAPATGAAAPAGPAALVGPAAPAVSASAAPRSEPASDATNRAILLVFLALANILGAALLFFGVAKGQSAVGSHECPSVRYSTQQPYPAYPGTIPGSGTTLMPVDPPPGAYSCDKPLAEPLLGLGFAPVLAVMVSGFLMSVLLDRRLRRFAVLQAGFFVLSVAVAVYGANTLVSYWS